MLTLLHTHREQPGVKVDADDLCWQWDPKQLSAFAKKLWVQDVYVYMSSIGISCKKVI